MTIEILPEAQADLISGFRFYERQRVGLGRYFLDCLITDIELLATHAGIHAMVFGYHRSLSKRFPFAIYYRGERNRVRIYAVLDCRNVRRGYAVECLDNALQEVALESAQRESRRSKS